MSPRAHVALALTLLLVLAGCASYPANPRLAQYDPHAGYRYQNLKAPGNSESLFVILTFSGVRRKTWILEIPV